MNDERFEDGLRSLRPRAVSDDLRERIAETIEGMEGRRGSAASAGAARGPARPRLRIGGRRRAIVGGALAAAAAILIAWVIGMPAGSGPSPTGGASEGQGVADAPDGPPSWFSDRLDDGLDDPLDVADDPMRLDRDALLALAPTEMNIAAIAAHQPEDLDEFLNVKANQMLSSLRPAPVAMDGESGEPGGAAMPELPGDGPGERPGLF
mgnify:CR=1 FL=1